MLDHSPCAAGLPLDQIEVLVLAYLMQDHGNGFVQSDLISDLWSRIRQVKPHHVFYNNCHLEPPEYPDWFVPQFATEPPSYHTAEAGCSPTMNELVDQINIKTSLHALNHN
jgi:hypothetical protein